MDAAIITGGAGAIGRALTHAFADAGYHTVSTDRRRVAGDPRCMLLDLTRFTGNAGVRRHAVARLRALLDGNTLRVIVNNAAIQPIASLTNLRPSDLRSAFEVNVLAPFLLVQAFAGDLRSSLGSVINVSTVHAKLTKPGFLAYSTTKAALSGLTRAMAVELGDRVRINAIAPGAIDTPMLRASFIGHPELLSALAECHPSARLGSPDDVAQLAVYLASDRAGFVNGATIAIDGAISARLHDPA